MRKFEHLSKKNRKDWIEVIQSVKNSDKGIAIISYLKWNLKKDVLVDLPCYSSPAVQDDFRKKICQSAKKTKLSDENIEIVKIFAPLTENPNAPYEDEWTPIHEAARNGHTEIVKILAPLTDNPNAPDQDGKTPTSVASNEEIQRILKSNTSRKRKAGPLTKAS